MDPGAAIALGVLGGIGVLIGTVVTLVVKSDRRPFEHLVVRAPTPIAAVRDGAEVTILGTARAEPGALLASPLTQRPCIAWWTSKRELSDEGRETIHVEIALRCGAFTVRDDSGEALVDGGEGGVVVLYLDDATAHRGALDVEHVLPDGARVLVAGVARASGGADNSGYRGMRRVSIHVGGKKRPLVVSNLPRYVSRALVKR